MSRPSPRVEIAHEALRRAIIEQALRPGTKLPEDEIGGLFGMSRTLVRATLARLQGEGLVDARPKRTATVAAPTLAEAREVFQVRRALEAEVVRLVVARWQPEFGAELEGHVRDEDEAKAQGQAPLSIRLAGEFHIRLAAMTGNALLQRYVAELVSRSSLILALHGRPHSSECAVNEHSAIIGALREGDAERACALMDEHVGSVERRALTDAEPVAPPALEQILSRYASALVAPTAAVPIGPRKAKAARR